jgi:hypothetical protein
LHQIFTCFNFSNFFCFFANRRSCRSASVSSRFSIFLSLWCRGEGERDIDLDLDRRSCLRCFNFFGERERERDEEGDRERFDDFLCDFLDVFLCDFSPIIA